MFSKELLQTSDYNKVISSAWTSAGQIGDNGACSIAYGDDITYGETFYCCDDDGNSYKSTDGTNFTFTSGYTSGTMEHGRVFYVHDRFITFATERTLDTVKYSPTYSDSQYTSLDLPSSANMDIDGACYFNGKYYIAGRQNGQGVVMYSEDLLDWSEKIPLDTTAIYSMCSTDNAIVISANDGIFITYDGINFIKVYNSIRWCPDVIFAFNKYIIIETVSNGVNLITTQDFENFNVIKNFPGGLVTGYGSYSSICFGLNKLVIGFNKGSINSPIANFVTTLDLQNWGSELYNSSGVGGPAYSNAIAYGNGRFIAVNENLSNPTNACAYKLWGIE